uniref:RdRp n=1 Tax=Hubei partiti-like virus 54 TaxID=1923063 RepID=A0A1L3KLL0_9VIRU|nr:RdRp [Hubei partiti-like virus 54]
MENVNGRSELTKVGFVCKGKFNRPKVDSYVKAYSKPRTTPYVDSIVKRIIESQGYKTEGLIDPANIYDPDQMFEGLKRYRAERKYLPKAEVLHEAFSFVFSVFARPSRADRLNVLSDVEMLGALKADTSCGIELLGKKGDILNQQIGMRREAAVRRGIKAPNPCQAFARTQRGNKTRLVWGYPIEMTMMEARFARPLIDKFIQMDTPMMIGKPKYLIGTRINCNIQPCRNSYSIDYSKYDSSIHEGLINMAFSILGTWFSPEDKETFAWQKIVEYFIRTPIVMPDGKLYVGKTRGVPSGSFFTQLIDSLVNLLLLKYVTLLQGVRLSLGRVMILGDDSIFGVDEELDISKMASDLDDMGITLNVEKSGHNTCHFLGAYWKAGLPHMTLGEIIKRAICPEKSRYINSNDPMSTAVETLQNLTAAWIEATILIPRSFNADYWLLRRAPRVTWENAFALERAMLAEGFRPKTNAPWTRPLR